MVRPPFFCFLEFLIPKQAKANVRRHKQSSPRLSFMRPQHYLPASRSYPHFFFLTYTGEALSHPAAFRSTFPSLLRFFAHRSSRTCKYLATPPPSLGSELTTSVKMPNVFQTSRRATSQRAAVFDELKDDPRSPFRTHDPPPHFRLFICNYSLS